MRVCLTIRRALFLFNYILRVVTHGPNIHLIHECFSFFRTHKPCVVTFDGNNNIKYLGQGSGESSYITLRIIGFLYREGEFMTKKIRYYYIGNSYIKT